MLGKSVLPRVLIRVTLLLPAHLPVLIGQRVSHSGGCRCMSVLGVVLVNGARHYLTLPLTLPHITHLTAKPSRMIGVQVGVCSCWCLGARVHTPTLTTGLITIFILVISVIG